MPIDKYKVLIRRCPDYDDPDRLRGIISEGMEEFGAKPRGKVLLKYNLVFAHPRFGRHPYTNPRVLEAIIDVLAARPEVEKIILGERTGIYVPTRYHFEKAGFDFFRKKPKVEICFFDEDKLIEVPLLKGGFHKSLRFSRTLIEADYKLYAPKLKHHVTTRMTCALKLNIGICDQKERLVGHDWRLEEKIADLYEVGHPDFIVVDAVDIGQQNEIFAKPLRLGAIMMGNSGVAIDSVGARILGFEPDQIEHLKIARSRGWPPVSDDMIDLKSELSWDEIRDKTKNFDYTFSDLQKLDTPIRFFLGNHPDGKVPCWGGCINTLKGGLAGFDANQAGSIKKARPVAMVVGEYEGDVDGQGFPVLLIGDCAKVKGQVRGRTIRLWGCPVGIPIFTLLAPYFLKVPSPLLGEKLSELYKFPAAIALANLLKFKNRVLG